MISLGKSSICAAALLAMVWGTGCDPEQPAAPDAGAGAAAKTTATAAAQATASAKTEEASARPTPVCTTNEKKVWAQHANTRTGLTATRFSDGRIAVGVAIGDHPHTLAFDAEGKGKLGAVSLAAGTELAKRIKHDEGVRHLQRVTVTAGMKTFADYRDKYESGRRRIACGSTGNEPPLLAFDGEPLLDVDDSGQSNKGKSRTKAPDAAPAGSAAASAAGSAEAAPTPPPPERELKEIRDCRSIASPDGNDVWALGTELMGEKKDGEVEWKIRFFALPDAGRALRATFHTENLGKDPKKLHTLEAPVAHRLADGKHVVVGRYKGRMLAWLLSKDKKLEGTLHSYGGGYPSLPRIVEDGGSHLLLTSQQVEVEKWKLRVLPLRKGSTLLDALQIPKVGDDDSSLAEPTLARIGDQRWLAYHAGDRREGRLTVVPVSDDLAEAGRAHVVTDKDSHAYESHLFSIGSELLLVYITRPDKGKPAELVSERLSCRVQK